MFSHIDTNTDTDYWRIIHRDSPGGATELCIGEAKSAVVS